MSNTITALGWCSKGSPRHLAPFAASLRAYLPDSVAQFELESQGNFGKSYNSVVKQILSAGHTTFAICNDDIVLRPDTWETLQHDWELLKTTDKPEQKAAGVLAARHDYVRMSPQNIRFGLGTLALQTIQYPEENIIININVISPILAVYTAESWIDFPEINWWSDDVQCYDIRNAGHTIWISRAYCHHVGSATMGKGNYEVEEQKSAEWMLHHRPDIYDKFMKSKI